MDRDDERDMQDMLMEKIVDINDPNIDWDNYSNLRRNYNNNIKDHIKKKDKKKTKMEILKNHVIDEFKQFIIENSQTDIDKRKIISFIDLEMEIDNKILIFNEHFSESISKAAKLDLRATYLLNNNLKDTVASFYKEKYKYDDNHINFKYTIKNETEFNALLTYENILINKLRTYFKFTYGEEYLNRIFSNYNFGSENGHINRLCSTIENIREIARYEFIIEDDEFEF